MSLGLIEFRGLRDPKSLYLLSAAGSTWDPPTGNQSMMFKGTFQAQLDASTRIRRVKPPPGCALF